MSKTITIAPLNKTITVRAPQAKAFKVFTDDLDRWWPKQHHLGEAALVKSVIEPRVGGRWLNTHADGRQTVTGHMRVWEPPSRIVFGWEIDPTWKPSTTVSSEVEVRFIAVDAQTTRVELEHRDFESMGQEGGELMRKGVDDGWPGILELFRQAAES